MVSGSALATSGSTNMPPKPTIRAAPAMIRLRSCQSIPLRSWMPCTKTIPKSTVATPPSTTVGTSTSSMSNLTQLPHVVRIDRRAEGTDHGRDHRPDGDGEAAFRHTQRGDRLIAPVGDDLV